jgi:hypothetical protein
LVSQKSLDWIDNMDMGKLNLAVKMIQEEFKLNHSQVLTLTRRMLADDREFERVWHVYKNRNLRFHGGVDKFKELLADLLG